MRAEEEEEEEEGRRWDGPRGVFSVPRLQSCGGGGGGGRALGDCGAIDTAEEGRRRRRRPLPAPLTSLLQDLGNRQEVGGRREFAHTEVRSL